MVSCFEQAEAFAKARNVHRISPSLTNTSAVLRSLCYVNLALADPDSGYPVVFKLALASGLNCIRYLVVETAVKCYTLRV